MPRRKTEYRAGNEGLLYLRVSTKSQVDTEFDAEGLSLPAQRRRCYEKARQEGRVIVAELIDPGVSGTSIEKRASYRELIERIRADKSISFVMVYALSRIHRNFDEDVIMSSMLRSHGVRLLSATEDIDDDTPLGRATHGFLAVMNEFQSTSSSIDIAYKMTQKALVGGTPGYTPIGYENVRQKFEGRDVNTVRIDEARAPFVRLAFELCATGQYTLTELQERLTEAGFRARPTNRNPARPVSVEVLRRLLRNRYYLGRVNRRGFPAASL